MYIIEKQMIIYAFLYKNVFINNLFSLTNAYNIMLKSQFPYICSP